MRRVARFSDSGKDAHDRINDWLRQNPSVTLIDIKPIMTAGRTTVIYAILDIPNETDNSGKTKNETEESK